MRLHTQDGAADNAWIIQLVVVLAIVGLVGVEAFKLAAAGLGADTDASAVLDVAEEAYEDSGRLAVARSAAETAAAELDVELVDLNLDNNLLEVTVRRDSNTLFIHRIVGEDTWVRPAATRSTSVRG